MPRSRKVPAKTASLTSLKWVGVTPHSVHQIGTSVAAVAGQRGPEVQRRGAVGVGGDEVDRGAGALGVRQQLLDPAGRGRGRSADPQPRVDRLHGVRGDVVEPQVLLRRAGPEDLEVGLVPDLEGPVLDHLVAAVALHQVRDQVVDQVVPAVPVLGRRDDRGVVEDRLAGVRGEVVRHERQLHDRVEPQPAQVVVDPVHSREVVDRVSVHLAVDPEVVAEDRVRPDVGDAELLVRGPERGGELGPDRPAAGGVLRERVGEVLAADHRPPRPGQRPDLGARVDVDLHRADRLGERGRLDGRAARALDVDVGQGGHGVPARDAGRAGGVGVRRVRHRQHVAAGVVERLERAVGRVRGVDLVADGPLDRLPGERHLVAAGLGAQPGRRVEPRRVAARTTCRSGRRSAASQSCRAVDISRPPPR